MLEEKVERLRKLQKESHALMDDILSSLEGKCKDTLFEVLETVLESIDEFPDTDTAVKIINDLAGTRHSHKKDSSKSKKGSRKDTAAADV